MAVFFATLCAAGPAGARLVENPRVAYRIEARLDPAARVLQGHETLDWYNHSDVPVPELQFHLYLNAFRNNRSSYLRERRWEGLALPGKSEWGWMEVDRLSVGGADLTRAIEFIQPDDANPDDRTVFRVPLPQPVAPRGRVRVEMAFRARLPKLVSRTGYLGDFYLAGQWFPKIGVWEAAGERGRTTPGWNCHQWHAWTDFYADYGTFDVSLTLPANLVAGATGAELGARQNPDGTTTWRFLQEDVHNFAWAAQPGLIRETRTFEASREVSESEVRHWASLLGLPLEQVRLPDVRVTLLLQREHRGQADRHFRAVFNAIKYFGLWYGRYPYETLTVVDPPFAAIEAGGKEYPTMFMAGTRWLAPADVLSPETIIVHEFGHQFWYGLVGNNEAEEPWLDEGLNTYSTGKVLAAAYGSDHSIERILGIPVHAFAWLRLPVPAFPWAGVDRLPIGLWGERVAVPPAQTFRSFYLARARFDMPARPGWLQADHDSYIVNAYTRPALMLDTLEGYLGEAVMLRVLRAFQQRFRFGHPSAADFVRTANEVSGRDLTWFFDQVLRGSGVLDYSVEVESAVVPPFAGVAPQAGRPGGHAGSESPLYENRVLVRRLGEVRFPVELRVTFENGDTRMETWDGRDTWKRFTYLRPDRVSVAQIDPENRIRLDVNFQNNSALLQTRGRAVQKWHLKWVFWLQNVFFAASFFS